LIGSVSRAWALFDLGRDPGPPPPSHPRAMLAAVPPEVAGLGLLHRGEHDAAAATLTEAADLWAPFHKRGELRCRWAAAEAVRRAGRTGEAVALLEAVEREVECRGMLPLLGRIHQSLRAAGRRRSAPRTRSAGSTLTGRQTEILALVGEGLTNAQIATRLGISRHTVVAQLASATAKLGATSRAQAAVLAKGGA
jgi:DNA-binding CsgD family transcriptional regulator